jgi:hypothetical protein
MRRSSAPYLSGRVTDRKEIAVRKTLQGKARSEPSPCSQTVWSGRACAILGRKPDRLDTFGTGTSCDQEVGTSRAGGASTRCDCSSPRADPAIAEARRRFLLNLAVRVEWLSSRFDGRLAPKGWLGKGSSLRCEATAFCYPESVVREFCFEAFLMDLGCWSWQTAWRTHYRL